MTHSETQSTHRRAGLAVAGRWLRGGLGLADDVYRGVVDIVEGVHHAVDDTMHPVNPGHRFQAPLRDLVYRQVRDIGALSFSASRWAADWSRYIAAEPHNARPVALSLGLQSALNGVCGDYLARHGNELALDMVFSYAAGHEIALDDGSAVAAAVSGQGSHLVVLIHGLGMNDRQWDNGHAPDYDQILSEALAGCVVLRVRYNTGCAIVDNGAALSAALDTLADHWPGGLSRITLVGHSMGGLVARAAEIQARAASRVWCAWLSEVVCLGSPHRGAALERLGDGLERGLGWSRFTAPFVALGRARSVGVQDLRHGIDWPGTDQENLPDDMPGARYLLIGASLSARDDDCIARLLGDLLVSVDSAIDSRAAAAITPARVTSRVFHRRHHFDLLYDADVQHCVRDWLRAGDSSIGQARPAESA